MYGSRVFVFTLFVADLVRNRFTVVLQIRYWTHIGRIIYKLYTVLVS